MITESLLIAFPNGQCTYAEFISHARGYLEAPLEMGYYLDRVILQLPMSKHDQPLDFRLFSTALSLALKTEDVNGRTGALHRMIAVTNPNRISSVAACQSDESDLDEIPVEDNVEGNKECAIPVSEVDVKSLLRFLVDTSQIPSEKLVVEGDKKYPFIAYVEATPERLLKSACTEIKLDYENDPPLLTAEHVHQILTSKAVCAWGSCAIRRRED